MKRSLIIIAMCGVVLHLNAEATAAKKKAKHHKAPAVAAASAAAAPAPAVGAAALPVVASPTDAPPLVSTQSVDPSDSDLVRAAKLAVASRQKSSIVIDAEVLKHASGRDVSEPTRPLPPIISNNPPPSGPPPRADADKPQPARQEMEAKLATLQKQQERLAAEAEQPFGGDVEEDDVARRMDNIRKQIEVLQKALGNPPQKP